MAVTATDLTREHYQRPEVREIITKFAMPGDGAWRALNGDFVAWYRYSADVFGLTRLLNAVEDYDEVTNTFRTLYQTLNVFDPSQWMATRLKNEITSDNPLGTPADTVAYTLGTDIDKGHGCNIEDPETKQAVEAAAQYLVNYLKDHGIHQSVWVLFSGGGIYVKVHHEICRPKSQLPDDRRAFFEELTDRFNRLIAYVSEEFFKARPEYIGKVKYDALNNSKRVFKCILSIHKSKPYAVTPLNRDAIRIDFDRARVPLKDDMISEAQAWYSTYDPAEREPLLRLLDQFKEAEEEKRSRVERQFKEIWRSHFKVDSKYFPPCIKHIIDTANPGEGKTRFSAVLSTFLYQAGWDEEEAWNLVKAVSARNDVGNAEHIFDSCFGRISCPSCKTIQTDATGYPHLGLKGLGACRPEAGCDRWPGDYAFSYALGDMQAAAKEEELKAKTEPTGPTVIDAIKKLDEVCDKATSKDGQGFSKFDREEHEDLIDKAVSEGYLSPKEEKTAYRFLKKYKKQLKGLGLAFDEIGHISRDGEAVEDGLAKINERIPDWIAEHHFKTVSDTERLYHYDQGVYLDDGETILKTLIETEFGDVTSNRLVQDVIGKVKRRTYVNRDLFNNRNVLNIKNGLLDLESLQLQPHTPDYLSSAQIDVVYNPDAKAPKIQKFLEDVAQPGDIALIEEIIGWLLWPDYNVHKAVMFLGPGRNGKGTLLRLITAFLGKKSISNVTLQDLVADRFAKADLYGKLANIGGDLPSKDLSDTAAFRNLTGGDDNRAQEKYRAAFSFRNKAKLIFSANNLPRSPDDTYAFYSRWILIEFLKVFDLQKGTADPDLDAKLQTPEELSGLLNIALAGLKRLRANGWKFSYDKTVEDVEIMYKRNANPVIAFLMDECEEDPGSYVEKGVLLSRFRDYSERHNLRPMTITRFGQLLKDQSVIPLSDYRPDSPTGKALPRCWLGVKFKSPSTPSIVLPTPSFPENENANEKEVKIKDREDRVYPNSGGCGGDGEIKADLLRAEEQGAAKEAHDRELAEKYTLRLNGQKASVRFNTDYMTDWKDPNGKSYMRQFHEGDVIEVPLERAQTWAKRGVVGILEASA